MAEPHPRVVDPWHPLVVRVRELCMPYPGATEKESWGRPTFRVGRMFAVIGSTMDDPLTLMIKADPEERLALLEDPRFFVPPYYGPDGWLGTALAGAHVDWTLLAELIDSSYRLLAPKRLLTELDSRSL